jgi:hypothetical protein
VDSSALNGGPNSAMIWSVMKRPIVSLPREMLKLYGVVSA